MSYQPTLLAFAGSARKASFNKRLIKIAVRGAEAAGAKVTLIDLKDFPLPLFNQDDEEEKGYPENVGKLKALFKAHDGLLISSPEYNSSISGLLKNTIDWISRREEGEKPLEYFTGKVVSLMSASPGALGGLRGLVHVRSILGNIGVIVLPDQVAVPKADEAFDEKGNLKDARKQAAVEKLGLNVSEILKKLKS